MKMYEKIKEKAEFSREMERYYKEEAEAYEQVLKVLKETKK